MDSLRVERDRYGRVLFVHVVNDAGEKVASLPCTRIELDSHGNGVGEVRITLHHNRVKFAEED